MAEIVNKELADKVVAREKRIEQWIKFITKLLDEKGKQVFYEQGSCHTRTKEELSYKNFFFANDLGRTMFGGNDLFVFYNSSAPNVAKNRKDLVLHICARMPGFQINECVVEQTGQDLAWQGKLDDLVANYDKVVEDLDRMEKERQSQLTEQGRQREEAELLQKKATRLGVVI